ncbi:MAG: histidinol-phosphatase [Kiritimatiellia bacterium]
MSGKSNFHTHSTWCDGRNTVEEMILGALAQGYSSLGFSSHAVFPADPWSWPLTAAKAAGYADEVRGLARKYAGRIRILCGVEADYIANAASPDRRVYAAIRPDYIIGSVHAVVAPDGAWVDVDNTPELLVRGVQEHFGGDFRAFVCAYFAQQRDMAATCDFDIIGHPDLVRKFNSILGCFDEQDAWYVAELERTAAAFAAAGKWTEVNTGGIARGWMDDAYPSPNFRARLRAHGVPFVLSADAHSVADLGTPYPRFANAEEFVSL